MNRIYASFVLAAACLALPLMLYAHSEGASFEKQTGDYLIDIGYDPAPPEAGRAALFDFGLTRISNNTPAPYDHVWVRVRDAESTLFASGIYHQGSGPTTLLYTFPKEGTYTLETSYRGARGEIASASFSVPVTPEAAEPLSQAPWFTPALFFAGVCVGVLGLMFYRRPSLGTIA